MTGLGRLSLKGAIKSRILEQVELKELSISSADIFSKSLVGGIESIKATENCDAVNGFSARRRRAGARV